MQKDYEEKYHLLEENQWWFTSRRDIIKGIIRKLPERVKILEIGCSGGLLIKELKKEGYNNIVGIDTSSKAIQLCKKKGIDSVFVMDGANPNFKESEFDIIIASGVLDHIKNDVNAVKNWKKILKYNGKIVCFVPAFKFLWGEHDVVNKHYKRYSKNQLINLFSEEGFKILRSSYWNFTLFFPTSIFRVLQRFISSKNKPKGQLYDLNRILNSFLKLLLKIENYFLKFGNFPAGVSIFLIVEKN